MKLKEKGNKILKKYSSKVGFDLEYFVKGSYWIGINQAVSLLNALVLSILFANIISQELYGGYTFVMAVLGAFSAFALPGLTVAVVQGVAKGYEGTYKKIIDIVFKISPLGSLALVITSAFFMVRSSDIDAYVFIFLALIFPFYSVSGYYQQFFNGKKKFDVNAKLNAIFNIISLSVLAITILFFHSLFWLVFATVFTKSLVHGYYTFHYVKIKKLNKKISEEDFSYAKKYSIVKSVSTLSENIDGIILPAIEGLAGLAVYTVGAKIPQLLLGNFRQFSLMFAPKLIGLKKLNKRMLIGHYHKIFLCSLLIVIAYWIIAPIIFKIFYPNYLHAVDITRVMSLLLLSLPNNLVSNYINVKGRIKFYTWLTLSSRISYIIILGILTFSFGLWGLIIGKVFHKLIITVVNYIYLWK